jgi:uncharacterized protein (TIGR02996 family)
MRARFKGLTNLIEAFAEMARATKSRWEKAEQRRIASGAAWRGRVREVENARKALEYRERFCKGEGEALIQGILAAPQDDFPRLVYADWLEERGAFLRAEFIRLQCEIAKLESDESVRIKQLQIRERDLLGAHGRIWAGFLFDAYKCNYEFRRGFLDAIFVPGNLFLAHAETLFHLDPITRIHLQPFSSKRILELAKSPYLCRLDELDLSGTRVDSAAIAVLAVSPQLCQLTKLKLSYCAIDDEGAQALARSPCLSNLTLLDLRFNPISEGGVDVLQSRFGNQVVQFAEEDADAYPFL